jgi:hypothetical protein|tara:strand:+ start:312 stop:521 length:210 start_codon:yes stop_codon:yes gene_type:complete
MSTFVKVSSNRWINADLVLDVEDVSNEDEVQLRLKLAIMRGDGQALRAEYLHGVEATTFAEWLESRTTP